MHSVYRRLAQWRPRYQRRIMTHHRLPLPLRSLWDDVTPSRVVGWIIARPETVSARDQQRLAALCRADAQVDQAHRLMRDWLVMIRHRTADPLDSWLEQMHDSGIPQFVAFARSVKHDKAAIVAGLTLPFSSGPGEGQITRLKLIKRQAYRRASLPYLQRRFLI
jgi:transposase